MGTVSRASTICNQRGLHARAAAKFVQLADGFESEINVMRGGQSVSGSSIMGLMMLAAGPGTEIQLSATGGDAKAALDAICALIEDRFQED